MRVAAGIISPPTDSLKSTGGWVEKNILEHLPHCWLDGLEALRLLSARQRHPRLLFRSVFFRYLRLPVMRHSVRTYDTLCLFTLVLLTNSSVRTKLVFPRIVALPMQIICVVLCFRSQSKIMNRPSLKEGGAGRNPGAVHHTAPRSSIRTHASQLPPHPA